MQISMQPQSTTALCRCPGEVRRSLRFVAQHDFKRSCSTEKLQANSLAVRAVITKHAICRSKTP